MAFVKASKAISASRYTSKAGEVRRRAGPHVRSLCEFDAARRDSVGLRAPDTHTIAVLIYAPIRRGRV
ncbi:hypothetical protein EVAR_37579_1 [Eumeta japonica]|uniref:Uncharacterized protein n=1 Tax=Eumeta variegata TaxID=151549 RepID=A0A4C1VM25_EUMVA|nr:hypothetical protein EVAR_37579_1 [Eumeta japonica]